MHHEFFPICFSSSVTLSPAHANSNQSTFQSSSCISVAKIALILVTSPFNCLTVIGFGTHLDRVSFFFWICMNYIVVYTNEKSQYDLGQVLSRIGLIDLLQRSYFTESRVSALLLDCFQRGAASHCPISLRTDLQGFGSSVYSNWKNL